MQDVSRQVRGVQVTGCFQAGWGTVQVAGCFQAGKGTVQVAGCFQAGWGTVHIRFILAKLRSCLFFSIYFYIFFE